MTNNVFGNPITTSTLEGMPEYRSKCGKIGRIDRARVAMNTKNAGGKDVKARAHVENLKAESGAGLANLILVYNATGDTIRYADQKDWIGLEGEYSPLIANGQWAAFLHVKNPVYSYGSTAAVVYRGKNAAGTYCDWMLSWSNPADRVKWDNTVCTEVRETNHFQKGGVWETIYNDLCITRSYQKDTWNGCTSIITTDSAIFSIVEGILTLEDV